MLCMRTAFAPKVPTAMASITVRSGTRPNMSRPNETVSRIRHITDNFIPPSTVTLSIRAKKMMQESQ